LAHEQGQRCALNGLLQTIQLDPSSALFVGHRLVLQPECEHLFWQGKTIQQNVFWQGKTIQQNVFWQKFLS